MPDLAPTPDYRAKISEWHDHYCRVLEEFCLVCEPDGMFVRPKLVVKNDGFKRAGAYRRETHTCYYYLPYAVMEGEGYAETVAHEVCHAYQKQLVPRSKWHGDFFLFLLRVVCKYKRAGVYHNMSVRKAKKISEMLRLAAKIKKNGGA